MATSPDIYHREGFMDAYNKAFKLIAELDDARDTHQTNGSELPSPEYNTYFRIYSKVHTLITRGLLDTNR